MIKFPNGKINLGLNIVGKRDDGFHNIETIFYPIALNDALEIIPANDGKFRFDHTGLPIPGHEPDNLCVKAFQLLKADFGLPGVKMHLHKTIPMGSGLGGGSSDGAFTLKMLNDLFMLGMDHDQLREYASRLGSDCAFFIENQTVFAIKKGDQFTNLTVDLSGLFIVIVIPDVPVATADAYRWVLPEIPSRPLTDLVQLPITEWKDQVVNDFEKPVFTRFPVIGKIRNKLYESGAVYASMSGSGSAVYGIFEGMPYLNEQFPNCFVWASPLF